MDVQTDYFRFEKWFDRFTEWSVHEMDITITIVSLADT